MNPFQKTWWEQAKSDYEMFKLCLGMSLPQCHALHFLQMATEKLAKAYFWRKGEPPPRKHTGFVQFLRFLISTQSRSRRIRKAFSFRRIEDFQSWLKSTLPIAYELERLSPDLAGDGPNPEYPWPHTSPKNSPVGHHFGIWETLNSSKGRGFLQMIHAAINHFPEYADS